MRVLLLLPTFAAVLLAQSDIGRVIPVGRSIHIVAFGDFGTGNVHEKNVAKAVAERNSQERFDIGITMGDNFYFCGIRNVDDPKWKTHWEDLYGPLGIPFYAALGNHDYGHPPIICPAQHASPEAEIAYTSHSKSWRMPARYYTYKAGPVQFIAIDTEGWSDEQLEWIKKTLADSASDPDVKWRVVYGHHPIYTSGVHLNERRIGELRRVLLPVLEAAHVDFYICGHDHDEEHLRSNGINFLICGGGGAKLRGFHHKDPLSVFTASTNAFLDITMDPRNVTAQFLDIHLKSMENPVTTVSK